MSFLFSKYNWVCKKCNASNSSKKRKCGRCQEPKDVLIKREIRCKYCGVIFKQKTIYSQYCTHSCRKKDVYFYKEIQ